MGKFWSNRQHCFAYKIMLERKGWFLSLFLYALTRLGWYDVDLATGLRIQASKSKLNGAVPIPTKSKHTPHQKSEKRCSTISEIQANEIAHKCNQCCGKFHPP